MPIRAFWWHSETAPISITTGRFTLREITDTLLTCEAVVAEATFHLGDAQLVLDFVTTGLVALDFVLAEHLSRIAEIAGRYSDRRPDLADLCLIRMSELHPRHAVITTDVADFRVYRRNRREAIPLIHPPSKGERPRRGTIRL